ncbi:hypothetical protein IAT38_000440 [Cryptococcus sp. DSM 104549]
MPSALPPSLPPSAREFVPLAEPSDQLNVAQLSQGFQPGYPHQVEYVAPVYHPHLVHCMSLRSYLHVETMLTISTVTCRNSLRHPFHSPFRISDATPMNPLGMQYTMGTIHEPQPPEPVHLPSPWAVFEGTIDPVLLRDRHLSEGAVLTDGTDQGNWRMPTPVENDPELSNSETLDGRSEEGVDDAGGEADTEGEDDPEDPLALKARAEASGSGNGGQKRPRVETARDRVVSSGRSGQAAGEERVSKKAKGDRKDKVPSPPTPKGRRGRQDEGGPRRTSMACETCRRRKHKCTGETPRCKECQLDGRECIYSPTEYRRGLMGKSNARAPVGKKELWTTEPAVPAAHASGSSSARITPHPSPSRAPPAQTSPTHDSSPHPPPAPLSSLPAPDSSSTEEQEPPRPQRRPGARRNGALPRGMQMDLPVTINLGPADQGDLSRSSSSATQDDGVGNHAPSNDARKGTWRGGRRRDVWGGGPFPAMKPGEHRRC